METRAPIARVGGSTSSRRTVREPESVVKQFRKSWWEGTREDRDVEDYGFLQRLS
jgi:hypothetical protein